MSEDNTIENMIDYAANADFNKANAVFNDMIAQKMDAAMDQERIAVAGKVFNDVEPEELEAEAEADEIEATAETEEASESEETEETDEAEVEGHPV
tara:strand:+ start:294 stop:581 length:288 start_codon:yes stop_codon:yes gene_type:complete